MKISPSGQFLRSRLSFTKKGGCEKLLDNFVRLCIIKVAIFTRVVAGKS